MKIASKWLSRSAKGDVASHFGLLPEFHAQLLDQIDFANRIGGARFVSCDAIGVEPAGKFVAIENRHVVAPLREFRGAGKRSGTRADAGDALAIRRAGLEKLDVAVENVVDGVALQAADLDRLPRLFRASRRRPRRALRWGKRARSCVPEYSRRESRARSRAGCRWRFS